MHEKLPQREVMEQAFFGLTSGCFVLGRHLQGAQLTNIGQTDIILRSACSVFHFTKFSVSQKYGTIVGLPGLSGRVPF